MAKSSSSSMACARHVVEVVPAVMRLIKEGIRSGDPSLSLPQMRVLAFVAGKPGVSLSEVCRVIDVTPATASIHIDRLVKQHFIERKENPQERRKVILTVTPEGIRHLKKGTEMAESILAEMLAVEPFERLAKIEAGLTLLSEMVKGYNGRRDKQPKGEVAG
jgi:DNA-binding MarR family transcriptional regulator